MLQIYSPSVTNIVMEKTIDNSRTIRIEGFTIITRIYFYRRESIRIAAAAVWGHGQQTFCYEICC